MSAPVAFAESLARKNYEAIGFIPRPRLEWYADRGQLLTAEENGEPAGFLVFGGGWPVLKVYQACVQYDARRREHGLALVGRLTRIALRRGCHAIALWCADDLEANAFWRAAGFQFAGRRDGGRARGRVHNRWYLPLDTPQISADLLGEAHRGDR